MAMNRTAFKKQLQEGLNTVFGLTYDQIKETWREYLDVETEAKKAYIEEVMMAGFTGAPTKAEGAGVAYQETSEIYTARYIFETIALAFAITEEAEEDNLYGSLGNRLSKALARAMQHTKGIKSADLLNNGFSASFPGGDAVALFSASHLSGGGASANLITAADLSETSVEDMLILIDDAEDYRGIPMNLEAVKLIIPTALRFIAHRVTMSNLRSGSAENDTNAMKGMNLLQGSPAVDKYLTDPDAWFIKTDCADGLKHVRRKAISGGVEGDFETGNMRYKKRERYVQGWSDWHGAYGSAGGG